MNGENNKKKDQKCLIIPDLHLQHERADQIIKHESADKIVFLGDYFDDWNDDYTSNCIMAEWLASSLKQPNRIHLFGNHDISYAFKHRSYKCSGYEIGKDYAINNVLKESDWRKLHLYTYVNDYLCSHAGVHNHMYQIYSNGRSLNTYLEEECKLALDDAFAGLPAHKILRAGRSRGGLETVGGIVWCDASEFVGIHGINQIFGHTPSAKPFWKDFESPLSKTYNRNLALDNYGHSNYYAIHDEKSNEVTIKWIGDY